MALTAQLITHGKLAQIHTETRPRPATVSPHITTLSSTALSSSCVCLDSDSYSIICRHLDPWRSVAAWPLPSKVFMPWSEYLIASWRLPPQRSSCHSGWLLTTHLHVRGPKGSMDGSFLPRCFRPPRCRIAAYDSNQETSPSAWRWKMIIVPPPPEMYKWNFLVKLNIGKATFHFLFLRFYSKWS